MKSEAARLNCACCGRRWGKDVLANDLAVEPLLNGQPVGWFEPTYKSLRVSWDAIRSILQPVTQRCSEQEKRIELVTGGVLDYWTLENVDSGRGRKYARVIINEAGLVAKLGQAWNNAIRPTLTDLKGDAFFFGTPKGRNTFHALHCLGMDPGHEDWAAWQMPTSANPYIDPTEIEAARRHMPQRAFDQEYLAIFLEDGGGVFRNVRGSTDKGRVQFDTKMPGNDYVLGADLARTEDFTVITVLDSTGRQAFFDRLQMVSWARQVTRIVDIAGIYGATVWLDATGLGDPICEAVQNEALKRGLDLHIEGYKFSGPAAKRQVIDALAIALEHDRLRLMDLDVQTNELEAFTYTLTPSGNVQMGAPEGLHDDTVTALGLANWGLSQLTSAVPIGITRLGAQTREQRENVWLNEEAWVEV